MALFVQKSIAEKKVMASVRIVRESDEWLASQKERFDAPVRKRAFEIYSHDHMPEPRCERTTAAFSPVADWEAAKHEMELLPLVGIDETERYVRISACVADGRCGPDSIITLRVMPRHIVAESESRFTVLDLPCPVRPDRVRAKLEGDQLSVVAERLRLIAN